MDSHATDKKRSLGDDDNQDIISTLPDDILSYILSVLPTKDAVRTSVLSTKWIYKWTCVTNLEVDDEMLHSMRRRSSKALFINFMNKVLSHIQSSTINNVSLRLSFDYKNEASILNSWISAVLNKGVRKLNIQHLDGDSFRRIDFILPYSFFKSETLVELKLELANCLTRVPSNNIMSNLKILKIFKLNFLSNSLSERKQIIFRFPVLKDFHMAYCTWLNVQNVIFVVPQLENFSAEGPVFGRSNDDARNSVINIFSLNLRKFSYRGFLTHGLIFSNARSVVEAYIDISYEYGKNNDTWHQAGLRACKLLTAFQKQKFLKLGHRTVLAMAHAIPHVSALSMFGSLTSLDLDMNFLLTTQNMVFILLHKLPVLERLNFLSDTPSFAEDFLTSMTVPHCFTSSLKAVEFTLFVPSLSLPIYVLQNTTFLERMTVKIKVLHKTGAMKYIVEQILQSFPRASNISSMEVKEIMFYEPGSL